MEKYKGLYDYRKIIASEKASYDLIRKIRWPQGVRCPRCEHPRNRHFKENGIPKHQCKKCDYKFSDITGTIFQNTKLPLSKWIAVIALFKIGLSALQLSKEISISYRIAWKLMHKLRDAVGDDLLSQLQGQIELDETYFGGREHRHRKYGKTGFTNKTPVIGILSRNGKVKTIALPNLQSHKIKQILKEHVKPGSVLFTDDHKLHRKFGRWGYDHKKINKLFGFLKEPDIHTNSIEGYWMLSKTKLYARHHQMSRKYIPKYLAETDYKYNNRNDLDPIRTIIQRLIFTPLSE
jgi:transposase-like protein/Zn ribbon nucleic-acid-binding protein